MMSWAKTATLPDGYVSNRRITIQPDFVLVRNEVSLDMRVFVEL